MLTSQGREMSKGGGGGSPPRGASGILAQEASDLFSTCVSVPRRKRKGTQEPGMQAYKGHPQQNSAWRATSQRPPVRLSSSGAPGKLGRCLWQRVPPHIHRVLTSPPSLKSGRTSDMQQNRFLSVSASLCLHDCTWNPTTCFRNPGHPERLRVEASAGSPNGTLRGHPASTARRVSERVTL